MPPGGRSLHGPRSLSGHRTQIKLEFQISGVLVDELMVLSDAVIRINDLINGDGMGNALQVDVAALLTVDMVLDVGIGLVRDENLA